MLDAYQGEENQQMQLSGALDAFGCMKWGMEANQQAPVHT